MSRFVTHDAHHAASAHWLREAAAGQSLLAAPTLLLPEVAGPIARITGSARLARRAVALLMGVAGLRIVTVDRHLADGAARLASDLRLRGADAIYVALAARLSLALITLDREQLDRAAAVVDVRRPS